MEFWAGLQPFFSFRLDCVCEPAEFVKVEREVLGVFKLQIGSCALESFAAQQLINGPMGPPMHN